MSNPEYFANLIVLNNKLSTFGESKESLEAMHILNNTKIHADSFKKKEIKPSDTCVKIRLALNPDDQTEDWTRFGSPIMENGMGGNIVGYWPIKLVNMDQSSKQVLRIVYPKFTIKCEVSYASVAEKPVTDIIDDTLIVEKEISSKENNIMADETVVVENTEDVVEGGVVAGEPIKKGLPKWAKFAIAGGVAVAGIAAVGLIIKGKKSADAVSVSDEVEE